MKALSLDGSHDHDDMGERVYAALTEQLAAQGWESEHVVLREKQIGDCGGEFFCWIKHPGRCMLDDDNRTIAAALVAADLVVYLTPVTFGGYSSVLKRMTDHTIQNISPFFARVEGETHHHKRYERYPDFLVVGWQDTPDTHSEAVFRYLVQRNAINWNAETYIGDVVQAGQTDTELAALAQGWLDDLRDRRSSPQVNLPDSRANPISGPVEVRRALLLVGSPKTRKSNSNALGQYLLEQLKAQTRETAHAIECATIDLHPALRSPEKTQVLLDAVDAADLVVLSFPLYVDSLPAPAIAALERIAAHRERATSLRPAAPRPLWAAIANSGFPEARHNASALAICETFAQEAGFKWAGGLALGAGGVVGGMPLAEGGGKTLGIRAALDLAAKALAEGQRIPREAQELLAKPVIPHWLYRLLGDWGWRQASKGFGARKLLKAQPYRRGAT